MSDTMQELFYRDPYAREFTAEVVSCTEGKKGFEVILTDTAFYPEGGGQPTDLGELGGVKVNFVKRINESIIHYTDQPLAVGNLATGRIDWERRFDNMQNHTCEHIFSGLIHQKFGFENVGFHMDPEDITVDFSGEVPKEELDKIEQEVNDAIAADIELCVTFPSQQELASMDYRSKKELSGLVRIVSVPGFDCCACCGTHVRRSGEIGIFKILESGKYRGGTRVRFAAGKRALRDYAWRLNEISKVSVLLSAKPHEISAAVEKVLNDGKTQEQLLAERTQLWLKSVADRIEKPQDCVIIFENGLSPFELKKFASILKERLVGIPCAVLSEVGENVFNYVLAYESEKFSEISRELNKKLNGRGGGRDGVVQGTYRVDRAVIESAVRDVFKGLIK